MKELLEAGVHIGHTVERWNPKMKKFVYGTKEGIHIIDIIKTLRYLHYACTFLQSAATVNKSILFVGTKSTASEVVPLASKECNAFYIKQRWLGGFLTNWCTMKKCIQKLQQLDNDLPTQEAHHKDGNINDESGILSEVVQRKSTHHASRQKQGLTKKEVLALKKQQMRLTKFFGGVKGMNERPDIVIILGQNEESNAVHECVKLQIPNITIVDTDCDPELADYPIPANDDSFRSIHIILQKLVQAYKSPFT